MSRNPPPVSVLNFRMDGMLSPSMRKSAESGSRRPMAGWLTTFGHLGRDGGVVPTVDREGQIMEAARELGHIDWTHYLAKGAWNDTHNEDVPVGRAHTVEFHDGTTPLSKAYGGRIGFWTRGELFTSDPASWGEFGKPSDDSLARSDHFWQLSAMLKAAGIPRRLGLSAHGEMAVSPCGKRILWARIRQAAVCELPMNPAATLDALEKAANRPGGLLSIALRKGGGGRISDASPCASCSCPEGGCKLKRVRKAVTSGNIAPVVPEDLEGSVSPGEDNDEQNNSTKERLIRVLMQNHHLSRDDAERYVVDYVARRSGPKKEKAA